MNAFLGTYGINKPLKDMEQIGDPTVFFLSGFRDAKQVTLCGTIPHSDKNPIHLKKTSPEWTISMGLNPGKYLYYFDVDGEHITDPENELLEPDENGKLRSVLFVPNHIFELDDYPEAMSVSVAGNFNNWDASGLKLYRQNGMWRLPIFLNNGTYSYKFVVDGRWIADPQNPILHPDENGNYNSFISIGSTTVFKLYGHTDARTVRLTGNFNMWNYTELQMQKTGSGWELPYTLGQGMYEYKFYVDNEWITDPDNPFVTHRAYGLNSLKCVRPNHVFALRGYADAHRVVVSGSFNDWDKANFEMVQDGERWYFPICLTPGEYSYVFSIDGDAICDPLNPDTHISDYGAESSVIKISGE